MSRCTIPWPWAYWSALETLFIDYFVERRPLDEFHCVIMGFVLLADIVDLDDVGVVEFGDGARLVLESLDERDVVCQVPGQHLHSWWAL